MLLISQFLNNIKLNRYKRSKLKKEMFLYSVCEVITIKNYMDPIQDKYNQRIFYDNNKKSGIYMLTNKINKKKYIGRAIDLNKRINRYFQESYLNNKKYRNYYIVKAIKKYGITNFIISILEYTNNSRLELIKREQYYIDNLNPEYNILRKAGNSLGYKHSLETKLKISLINKGRKLNLEAKKRISFGLKMSSLVGHKHRLATKLKLSKIAKERNFHPKEGLEIIVKDMTTGFIKEYKSIREAARDLKADTRSIRSRIPNKKGKYIKPRNPIKNILFRNKYLICLTDKK